MPCAVEIEPQRTPNEQRQPNHLTKLIVQFYNFLSIMCVSPFSVSCDQNGEYESQPFSYSRLFAVAVNLSVILVFKFWSLWSLNYTKKSSSNSPDSTVSKLGIVVTIVWYIWLLNSIIKLIRLRKSGKVERVLELIKSIAKDLAKLGAAPITSLPLTILSVSLFVILGIWIFVDLYDRLEVDAFSSKGISQAVFLAYRDTTPFIDAGKWLPGPHNNENQSTSAEINTFSDIPVTYYVFTTLWLYSFTTAEVIMHLHDFICLCHAVSLLSLTSRFVSYLKVEDSQGNEMDLIFRIFDKLCELSCAMNDTVGSVLLVNFCGMMISFPYFLPGVLSVPHLFTAFKLCMRYLFYFATYVIGAEANSRIKGLTSWLREKYTEDTHGTPEARQHFWERLCIIEKKIDENSVGLKVKRFTITYGFVGNVFTLLISYAAIFDSYEPRRKSPVEATSNTP